MFGLYGKKKREARTRELKVLFDTAIEIARKTHGNDAVDIAFLFTDVKRSVARVKERLREGTAAYSALDALMKAFGRLTVETSRLAGTNPEEVMTICKAIERMLNDIERAAP